MIASAGDGATRWNIRACFDTAFIFWLGPCSHEVLPTMHAQQRPAWRKLAIAVISIGALAGIWRFSPLAEHVTPHNLASWSRVLRQSTWAPIALVLAFIPAAFVMFPLPLLILIAVLAFGPWLGLSYGMAGAAAAIAATYGAGRVMRYETLRSFLGGKLDGARDLFHGHTIVAAFAISTVPVPPFGVQGIMAGAMRVTFWQYAVGTLLAMLPGAILAAVFGRQIARGFQDPSTLSCRSSPLPWWRSASSATLPSAGRQAVAASSPPIT